MKLLSIHAIPKQYQHCVATIGNFDGIHVGHQYLLEKLHRQSQILQLPAVVILFEPQPQEFFMREAAPGRLTSLREKVSLLKQYQIDAVVCLKFNVQLANLNPHDFMQSILQTHLKISYLLVGDDFRFGRDRAGDTNLLYHFAEQYGFTVASMESKMLEGERISSSRIRQALKQGDLTQAKQLLGRDYSLCGRVIYGDQRGRTIGFPTANIALRRLISPISGVYAVQVKGIGDHLQKGVANLGKRPTVDGIRQLLEVHLFDFEKDIYGQYLEVKFLKKLRDEKRFDSFDLLKAQIQRDADEARIFLSGARND